MAKVSLLTHQLLNVNELHPISIGLSSFLDVRKKGKLLVDKTGKLAALAELDKVFFSRPRRFGKTMLISMLKELFMHGVEQFKGLAVYDSWTDKQCYPVISLTFYGLDDPQTFEQYLCQRLRAALKSAGFAELGEETEGISDLETLWTCIHGPLSASESMTVWLIDEWDYALSNNLDNHLVFDALTKVLHKFFGGLRSLENTRFILVTGIGRYSNTSLFTGQDIINISMDYEFADLLGYTQAEVEASFAPYIARAAELFGLRREELLEHLKLNYDGFCFDTEASVSLYCPWSINNFFQQLVRSPNKVPAFGAFWMNSSNASDSLRSYLSGHKADLEFLDRATKFELAIAKKEFNAPSSFAQLNMTSIMVQSGYLTIRAPSESSAPSADSKSVPSSAATAAKDNVDTKVKDDSFGTYLCGFPNLEVEALFANVAFAVSMTEFGNMEQTEFDAVARQLNASVVTQDIATMTRMLNSFLVRVYYDNWLHLTEVHYRTFIVWALLAAKATSTVRAETFNYLGRSDIELECNGRLLVIELKRLPKSSGASHQACLSLAQEAQEQILGLAYGDNLATWQHPRFVSSNAVVLVISERYRQIVYWRLLSLDKKKAEQDPLIMDGWIEPLKRTAVDATLSKKKSAPRSAAKQDDVARDEGRPATSGEVTTRKGEEEAGSAPSGDVKASAAVVAGTASKSQSEVKTNPSLDKTDLFIAFDIAQQLADSADNVVTLDPAMLARGLQSYVAMMQEQKGTCSQEQIKDYVGRYIDQIQQVALPEKAKTFDCTYLEQKLVALLTKVL